MVGGFAGAAAALVVAPVFHPAHLPPVEDDAVGGEDFEMTGDEAGMAESLAGDLAFAFAGGGVGPPGHFAGGDVFIAGDLGGDPAAFREVDPDHLLKVAVVVADPLSCKVDG